MNYTDQQLAALINAWKMDVRHLFICFYCGVKLRRPKPPTTRPKGYALPASQRTIEHVVPISRGGQNVEDNRVHCCRICNHGKGPLLLEEFRVKRYNSEKVEFFFETEIRRRVEVGLLIIPEFQAPLPLCSPEPYDQLAD
jgi:hypothetical protein